MKPSEIMDAVFGIDKEITTTEERLAPLKDRLEVLGYVRSDVRSLLDAGAPWTKLEERLKDLEWGVVPDAPSPEQLASYSKDAPLPYKVSEATFVWAVGDRVKRYFNRELYVIDTIDADTCSMSTQGGDKWAMSPAALASNCALVDRAPHGRLPDGTPRKKPGPKTTKMVDDGQTVTKGSNGTAVMPDGSKAGILVVHDSAQPKAHPCLDRKLEQLEAIAAAKPHVAPLSSPLTPELRATLEHALGASPTTAYALSKLSALHGFDVEALLCEAPETFINWTDPGPQKYSLWGLPHQFDAAVRSVSVPDMLATYVGPPTYVAKALGCSVSAALAAWARLDPEAK